MKRSHGLEKEDLVPAALQKFRDRMDTSVPFTCLLDLHSSIGEVAMAKRKKVFDEFSPMIVTKYEGQEMGDVFTKIDTGIRNVIVEMIKINQHHKERIEALFEDMLEHYCAEYKRFAEGKMSLNPGMGVDVLMTHFEHEKDSVIKLFQDQVQQCAQEQMSKLKERITEIQTEIEEKVARGFSFTSMVEPGSTTTAVGVKSFNNFELRPSRLNICTGDSSTHKEPDGDFRGEPSTVMAFEHKSGDGKTLANHEQESLTSNQKKQTLESDQAHDTKTAFRKLKHAILRKCNELGEKRFRDCNFQRESFLNNEMDMTEVETLLEKYKNFSETKYQQTHTRLVEVLKMAKKMFSTVRKSTFGKTKDSIDYDEPFGTRRVNLVRLDDALVWLSDFRMDLSESFTSKKSVNKPFAMEQSYNILQRMKARAEESDSNDEDYYLESSESSEEEEEDTSDSNEEDEESLE